MTWQKKLQNTMQKMAELIYTHPETKDIEKIKELTENTIEGTELYTYISVNPPPYDSIFCGKDEKGIIRSLIFDDGDRNILSFGCESSFMPCEKPCIMVYKGEDRGSFTELTEGTKIEKLYKLLSGSDKLSADNEKRYVYRLRCVNKEFSYVYGIYEKGELISTASIGAVNKRYALISDVYTKKQYRNKKLAQKNIESAVKKALSLSKIPYIKCVENMCGYYESSGFIKYENL